MPNAVLFPAMRTAPADLRDAIHSGKLDTSYKELKKILNNEYGTGLKQNSP